MKKRLFCCVLAGISGAVLYAPAGDIEAKLQMLVPKGVSLGMGQDELQMLRPKATPSSLPVFDTLREARKSQGLAQSENVITNLPIAVLHEADLKMPTLFHAYFFVGGKLRAVKGNVGFMRGEKDEGVVKQVLDRLSAQMTRQPDVDVIASGGDLQPQTVAFAHWRDERAGKALLVFDSPKGAAPGGTQVILFDEEYFGRKDFLYEPDDLPKLEPLYEEFRKHKAEHEARMQELRREIKKGAHEDDDEDDEEEDNEKEISTEEEAPPLFIPAICRALCAGVFAVLCLCAVLYLRRKREGK
jgi:hypothetical protein